MLVIDGDGHYLEATEEVRAHIDPAYREQAPRFVETEGSGQVMEMLGTVAMPNPFPGLGPGDILTPQGIDPARQLTGRRYEEAAPGGFDPHARLEFHDAEGIHASVLFPSLGLLFGGITDPDVAVAFASGLNDWLAGYCSVAPRELYGVANLPVQDPERAAEELKRCVTQHGFVAGFLRPNPYPVNEGGHRLLGDPANEVIWTTAEELGVPICIHEGTNVAQPAIGQGRAQTFLVYHAIVHPTEMMLAFGSLYEAGVFDRHPHLRVGFMEANCGWLPFWLHRMDEHRESMGWSAPLPLERRPSEVFRTQCWIGCEGEEWGLGVVLDYLADARVMWASDYPHFDAKEPGHNVATLLERDDVSEDHKRMLLGASAAAFYGLDGDVIEKAVALRRGGTSESAASSDE